LVEPAPVGRRLLIVILSRQVPFLLPAAGSIPQWSQEMRHQKCFRARAGLTAGTFALSLFVSGADVVRAQTSPSSSSLSAAAAAAAAPAQAQGPRRRLSIQEAGAQAHEQKNNLQVDRIDPQVSDLAN
jgi:hypothetical protein